MKDDGRGQQRLATQLRTVYHDEIDATESDSLMSNLSLGGCFVRSSRLLPRGSTIRLKFRLPGVAGEIGARGEVRWVRDSQVEEQRGMGIQFTEIDSEGLVELKRFMADSLSTEIW